MGRISGKYASKSEVITNILKLTNPHENDTLAMWHFGVRVVKSFPHIV